MASTITANFRTNAVAMLSGFVDIGDVAGGASASLPVGGQVVSASRTSYSQGETISVVLPNMGSVTYPLWVQVESRGASATVDNNISVPTIRNKTAIGFDLFLEETAAVAQNLRIHIYAFPTGVVTNMVTPAASFVTADSGEVVMDNLKVRPTLLNGDGCLIGAVSGTFQANLSGWCSYALNSDSHFGSSRSNVAVTTTYAPPFASWGSSSFNGNEVRLLVIDRTTKRAYRVTVGIEAGAGNSFAMIERLA